MHPIPDLGPERPSSPRPNNGRLAVFLLLIVGGMLGLSFAAVPLYRIFCAATGYGGTPQRVTALSNSTASQTVTVHFDANVSPALAWSFKPLQQEVTLHIGENKLAFYRAKNLTNEALTGRATYNVSPPIVGLYFDKVQCFCFKEQTLKPGESMDMPVSFFIDPEILKDHDARTVHDITLSYTFFRAKDQNAATANIGADAIAK
jgi:cytochrome c oxidase assembly protein subunit 11